MKTTKTEISRLVREMTKYGTTGLKGEDYRERLLDCPVHAAALKAHDIRVSDGMAAHRFSVWIPCGKDTFGRADTEKGLLQHLLDSIENGEPCDDAGKAPFRKPPTFR